VVVDKSTVPVGTSDKVREQETFKLMFQLQAAFW
jgi:UDP-glucose 6-dehydrogenase